MSVKLDKLINTRDNLISIYQTIDNDLICDESAQPKMQALVHATQILDKLIEVHE